MDRWTWGRRSDCHGGLWGKTGETGIPCVAAVGNTAGERCLGFTHMVRSKIRKEEKKKHVDREKKGNEQEKWQYKSAHSFSNKNVLLLCLEIWAVLGARRVRGLPLKEMNKETSEKVFLEPQSVTSDTKGAFYLSLPSLLWPDDMWMRILDCRTLLLSFPRHVCCPEHTKETPRSGVEC